MRNITKAISRTLLASPGRTSAIGDNKRSTTAPLVALPSVCGMATLGLSRISLIFFFFVPVYWSAEGVLTVRNDRFLGRKDRRGETEKSFYGTFES